MSCFLRYLAEINCTNKVIKNPKLRGEMTTEQDAALHALVREGNLQAAKNYLERKGVAVDGVVWFGFFFVALSQTLNVFRMFLATRHCITPPKGNQPSWNSS